MIASLPSKLNDGVFHCNVLRLRDLIDLWVLKYLSGQELHLFRCLYVVNVVGLMNFCYKTFCSYNPVINCVTGLFNSCWNAQHLTLAFHSLSLCLTLQIASKNSYVQI